MSTSRSKYWVRLSLLASSLIISVTNSAAPQGPQPPAAVLTQRYDNGRTGANLQEYLLNVAAVSSTEFQKLYTVPVNGQVYAQPLLVPQVRWADGTIKNLLIVATAQNWVHAFQVDDPLHKDATYGGAFTPISLWSSNLGNAVPANFMPMGYSSWTCVFGNCWPNISAPTTPAPLPPVGNPPSSTPPFSGLYNINPSIGIMSTPVIDSASGTLYAVAKVSLGSGAVENHLVAINLVNGQVLRTAVVGSSAQVAGSSLWRLSHVPADTSNGILGFDQSHHMQRAALLLQNGQLYIGFGSHQDTPPWHGWIFRYDPVTLQPTGVWCSTPNWIGGSIWQAGHGIAGGADGNIYVMTGNGIQDDNHADRAFDLSLADNANQFVQLSPALGFVSRFSPGDEAQRDQIDVDLGSSGPVLFPGTNILIGGDKEGRIFVLDTTTGGHLGMRQIFQAAHQLDSVSVSGSGYHHFHGAPVVWRSPSHLTVYFWPERDNLRAFYWDDAAAVFDCSQQTGGCVNGSTTAPDQLSPIQSPTCPRCMPGGFLSISANGSASGTGILWASVPLPTPTGDMWDLAGGAVSNVVPGQLRAFNAENITVGDIWNSQNNASRDGSFLFAKYTPPVVANGRLYMATFSNAVNVYGLRQWAKYVSSAYPQVVAPGAAFTAQVTLLNAGTTVWAPGSYRLGSQAPQDNTIWGTNRVSLSANVNPGDQVTVTLNLTAPSTAGLNLFRWQMVQEGVEWFGEPTPAAVQIQVGGQLSATATRVPHAPPIYTMVAAVTERVGTGSVPIPGATVTVSNFSGATTSSGTTAADGTVTLTYPTCFVWDTDPNDRPIRVPAACPMAASKPGYISASIQDPNAP